MPDPSLKRLRKDARFLRMYSNSIVTRAEEHTLELRETNETLKELSRKRNESGETLTRAAAILLIAPDPLTGAAAIPVLIAAQLRKIGTRKKSELGMVCESANAELNSILSASMMKY